MTALLRRRLVRRSVLLAQVTALGIASFAANAAVIDSGPVNINVPNTTQGVYLNVVTNTNATTPAGAPGWDLNPWGQGGNLSFFTETVAANISAMAAPAAGQPVTIFTPGQTVSGSNTFASGTVTGTGTACRQTGSTCIVGFRFNREATTTTHFGYAILSTTGPSGFPAAITRYFWEDTPNTAITVTGGATAPQFAYAPAAGGTVNFTGGGAIGSTGTGTITVTVGTPGSGTGAAATTTTTCTAPAAPFAGFGQTVTAVGTGAITGSPLSGTCTLGAAVATATLTCSENRGGTAVPVTFQLSCPAGTLAPVTSNPTSGTTIAFGSVPVGSPATRQVTFSNSAGTAQTVTCTATAAPFATAPLSIPVPAGGSASTTITFTPTATGPASGTLNCTSGATTFAFPLTGTGVAPAVATSVPTLGDAGRLLAILMLLGIGLAALVVRKH